jgi:hypothetical protein
LPDISPNGAYLKEKKNKHQVLHPAKIKCGKRIPAKEFVLITFAPSRIPGNKIPLELNTLVFFMEPYGDE